MIKVASILSCNIWSIDPSKLCPANPWIMWKFDFNHSNIYEMQSSIFGMASDHKKRIITTKCVSILINLRILAFKWGWGKGARSEIKKHWSVIHKKKITGNRPQRLGKGEINLFVSTLDFVINNCIKNCNYSWISSHLSIS